MQIIQKAKPAPARPLVIELKEKARSMKSPKSYIRAKIAEEYVNILIFLREESAVIPLSIQVLQMQTNIIRTIEQIVAGKYKTGFVICKHTSCFYVVVLGYVFAGHSP